MLRNLLFVLVFVLGFFTHSLVFADSPPKVTGVGGIFFKSKDPKVLKKWYSDHLGMAMDDHGTIFKWQTLASQPAQTQWSVFPADTKYLEPSPSSFMINYMVTDLDGLVAQLRRDGVTVVDDIDRYDFGSFVHILDCEGNKIELWQPK